MAVVPFVAVHAAAKALASVVELNKRPLTLFALLSRQNSIVGPVIGGMATLRA